MSKALISLAIKRSEIDNIDIFRQLLDLYGLEIVAKEPQYYIIEGDGTSKQSFLLFWNDFAEDFRKYMEVMQNWRMSMFRIEP